MFRKKKFLITVAIALLFLCDYLYWTTEMPLAKKLPEEIRTSVKVDLICYDVFFDSQKITVESGKIAELVDALEETTVTRRPKFATMSQPFFYLYLYYPDGYTSLTVVENGNISADPDMRSDRRIYFDGGEELFAMLKGLMDQSPAEFPTVPSSFTP